MTDRWLADAKEDPTYACNKRKSGLSKTMDGETGSPPDSAARRSRPSARGWAAARAGIKTKTVFEGQRPIKQLARLPTSRSDLLGGADQSAYAALNAARKAHNGGSAEKMRTAMKLAASAPVSRESKTVNFARVGTSLGGSAVSLAQSSQKIQPFPELCNQNWRKTIDEFLEVMNSNKWVPGKSMPDCASCSMRVDKTTYIKSVATVNASIQHIMEELQDPKKFHSMWSVVDSTFVQAASKGYLDIEYIDDAFGGQKRGGGVCHAQFRLPGTLGSQNFVWAETSGVLVNGDAVIVCKDTKHPSAATQSKSKLSTIFGNNSGRVGLSGYLLRKSATDTEATEVNFMGQLNAVGWIEKMATSRRTARLAGRAQRVKQMMEVSSPDDS